MIGYHFGARTGREADRGKAGARLVRGGLGGRAKKYYCTSRPAPVSLAVAAAALKWSAQSLSNDNKLDGGARLGQCTKKFCLLKVLSTTILLPGWLAGLRKARASGEKKRDTQAAGFREAPDKAGRASMSRAGGSSLRAPPPNCLSPSRRKTNTSGGRGGALGGRKFCWPERR